MAGLVSPKVEGALGDAKLVRPPVFAAAPNPPPTPENPFPKAPKPEPTDAEAKPDLLESAGLKTDGVDAPMEPNGDLSEPAKAASEDVANALPAKP